MSEPTSERVLLPVKILEGETIDEDLAKLLSSLDVLVLGYHVVPEQTAPSQMRQQFETQAQQALDAIVQEFEDAGGTADSRLAFTHDADQTIERIGEEVGATAVAYPNPVPPIESIFVPVREEETIDRLVEFIGELRAGRPISLRLSSAQKEEVEMAGQRLERTREKLIERGIEEESIDEIQVDSSTPAVSIIDGAIAADVTVMAEPERDWRTFLFGELEERVAAESLGPVLVVKLPQSETDEPDDQTFVDE